MTVDSTVAEKAPLEKATQSYRNQVLQVPNKRGQ